MTTGDERRRLTEPLDSVTTFFGALMIMAVLVGAAFLVFGSGGYGGLPGVCVTQPSQYSSSAWKPSDVAWSVTARPGHSITINGAVQVCADHPTLGEYVLYLMTGLTAALFWGSLLFLLWRLMVTARRSGPFTPRVAAALRRLGWFIIIGSAAAAVLNQLATALLLTIMAKSADSPFTNLLLIPVHLPIPLLTGAALLTFARILRAGAAMDAELQATI